MFLWSSSSASHHRRRLVVIIGKSAISVRFLLFSHSFCCKNCNIFACHFAYPCTKTPRAVGRKCRSRIPLCLKAVWILFLNCHIFNPHFFLRMNFFWRQGTRLKSVHLVFLERKVIFLWLHHVFLALTPRVHYTDREYIPNRQWELLWLSSFIFRITSDEILFFFHKPLKESFRGLHTLCGDSPPSASKYRLVGFLAARLHFEKIVFFIFEMEDETARRSRFVWCLHTSFRFLDNSRHVCREASFCSRVNLGNGP